MSPPPPPEPSSELRDLLRRELGLEVTELRAFASLWAGFGALYRTRGPSGALVLKVIDLERTRAPDPSTRRKRESYLVEERFYRLYSEEFPDLLPRFYGSLRTGALLVLVLEDLTTSSEGTRTTAGRDPEDVSRPPRHRSRPPCAAFDGGSGGDVDAVLRWLAAFHARTLTRSPEALWERGTYFHLATRLDEFERIPPGPLRAQARALDQRLREARHQSWVHGDAKPANFLIARSTPPTVRAVDFQYVGRGPGIVDVAYFANAVLPGDAPLARSLAIRDAYLTHLSGFLPPELAREVLEEWRGLYGIAWADFHRFLLGWAPGAYDDEPLSLAHVALALADLSR